MAESVIVDGPAHIYVGTGTAGALEALGYSANGVECIEEGFFLDVPGDQNGGDAGPPIDIQKMGDIHRVRMELTKFDSDIADKLASKLNGVLAGLTGTPGTLIAAGGYGYRLLINSTLRPRNYLFAIPRQPVVRNKGTRYTRLVIDWECHAVSGVVYNTTTS